MENQTPVTTPVQRSSANIVSIIYTISLIAALAFNIYVVIQQIKVIRTCNQLMIIEYQDNPEIAQQIAADISTAQWYAAGIGFTIAVLIWAILRQIGKYIRIQL